LVGSLSDAAAINASAGYPISSLINTVRGCWLKRGLGDIWKQRGQLVDGFAPGHFNRICKLPMLLRVMRATSDVVLQCGLSLEDFFFSEFNPVLVRHLGLPSPSMYGAFGTTYIMSPYKKAGLMPNYFWIDSNCTTLGPEFSWASPTAHPLTSLCQWRNFTAWPLAKSVSTHPEKEYRPSSMPNPATCAGSLDAKK
jgi:hypothetical protein